MQGERTIQARRTLGVIKTLQGWFRTFGYAKRVRHDDGPGFRDRFVEWLSQVGCKSELSSAYNPASNGLAEACSPAHFVEKHDAEGNIVGVRLVCDLKKLNDGQAQCYNIPHRE